MLKKLIAIALAAMCLTPGTSFAQSLTWKFQSFDNTVVDVRFYPENRTRLFPANSPAYSIDGHGMHSYTIACAAGEKICFGAWMRGNASAQWGKGKDDKNRCNDCCYTCNGGATPTHKLNESTVQHDSSHLYHFY
jgi:hypothetical protein